MADAEPRPWRGRLLPILAAVAVVAVAATIRIWAPRGARSASGLSASQLSPARPSPTSSPSPAPEVTAAQLAHDHWSRISAAPIPARAQAAAAWTGTRMLVWGGAINDQLRDDGAAYDPASDSWTTLPAAPLDARTGMASVWTGGAWFLWGGFDTVNDTNQHVAADGALYDPAKRTWQKLPPSPLEPRQGAQALWFDGKVIVLGGQPAVATEGLYEYGDMAAYDPATNRWKKLAALPRPKDHSLENVVATATNEKIYAWEEWSHTRPEGGNGTMTTDGIDLYIYDPARNRWTPDLAASRFPDGPRGNNAPNGIASAVSTGSGILSPAAPLFCGFCPGPPPINSKGALLDVATNSWTTMPHGPVDDLNATSFWTGAALLSIDSTAYVGGPHGGLPGDAAAWDPVTDAWTSLPPAPLAGASVAVWAGDRLIEWGSMFVPSEVGGGSPPAQQDAGLAFGP